MNNNQTVSTGISELDQRLGGLASGRYYLLTGTPGAGKTSACLHFLAEGLRAGEPCAILTQENPDDLFAQAQFIGHDFRRAVADDSLALLQYRMDFSDNYSRVGNPKAVAHEMVEVMTGLRPRRLVVDSILPFIHAGGAMHGAATSLLHVMDDLQCTAYFTVPGDLGDSFYARLYDPLVSGTAGVLHFEMAGEDVRQVSIRKIRQAPMSSEPLRFVIRPGLGIVEISDAPHSMATAENQRRVALVNSGGFLGGDLFASLAREYDLESFASADEALPAAADGFALVLLAVDPVTADGALSFVRALRRTSGVPIVLLSHAEGLRAVTRARAIRAGADEFLEIEESARGTLARIDAARLRGPRGTRERLRPERLLVQPRDERARPVALPEEQILRAVRHHVRTAEHPFFAIVRLRPPADALELAWDALVRGLRLGDGDLIAHGDRPGEIVLYLHDISRRHARELLSRIFAADPRFDNVDVDVQHYPADAPRIESWLEETAPAAAAPAVAPSAR
ncbi:MAG: recombination protein RecA [Gemmatimonadetes bacterium]|jgi:KaiC/GvpD/RAD55 family RecA-like ATPase|nr:recombination protein RecA [Gemmatimonadota bacterium]